MAKVVDNASGKLIDVEDQEAERGLVGGQFSLKKGQQVAVRNPAGEMGSIPAEQFEDAVKQGFTLSNEQELRSAELEAKHGGIGGIARAGAEGAARGLTFGLSDVAARELSPELANEMAERKEAHPIASTVGEVGGAIAPTLIAPEAGLIGRGIRGAGILPRAVAGAGEAAGGFAARVVGTEARGLIGQVAQRAVPLAAQGAVEGAAYGAGHAVSEAALGDTPITAEKVIAGAKEGAIFGAGAGGLIGAGEVAVKKAVEGGLKLIGKESVQDFFRSFANERTIKALGATQRDIQRLGTTPEKVSQRMDEISESVLGYRFKDGEKLFRASSTTEELAERTARAAEQEGSKIGAVYKKVDRAIERGKAEAPDLGRMFRRVDDEVLGPLLKSDSTAIRMRAGKVLDETASLREAWSKGEQVSVDRLVKARQDLQNVIQPKAPAQMGIPPLAPEHAEQLAQTRRIIQDEIESTIHGVGGDLSQEYQSAKRLYGDLKDANKLASRWSVRDLGNRAVSPTDYLTGIGSGVAAAAQGAGGLLSFGTGLLASAAHNVVRERGSVVLAAAADAMANKIASLNAMRTAAASVDRAIESGVGKLVEPTLAPRLERAAVRSAAETGSGYRETADRVREVASNPGAVTQRVATQLAPVEPHAPDIAGQIARVQTQRAAFVASAIPRPPGPIGGVRGIQAHLERREPSKGDQASFLRTVAAVDKPKEVLKRLGEGRLTIEDAQAIRQMPEILAQVERLTREKLAKSKVPLSFQARMQLGMLFDAPVDEALSPAFIADMQQMYAQRGGAPAPGGQGAAPTPRPKAGKIDVSSSMTTTAQQVQMGGR